VRPPKILNVLRIRERLTGKPTAAPCAFNCPKAQTSCGVVEAQVLGGASSPIAATFPIWMIASASRRMRYSV